MNKIICAEVNISDTIMLINQNFSKRTACWEWDLH